ncbi:acetyltransferase [Ferrimonas balearica]|uniref:acetyltransferase n=1 Tax=Ferrimonas balearica TaxID=44012 RepID=UPI001C9A16D6|nr:acetyltransferase [Ferrimonas balearica]MBY5920545.1 acetyltransferase [Ferrimonas balearica]MBY5996770.1 acetyltransferase [Ferrimonas balearica]
MLLRDTQSGDLVEVMDTTALVNPFADSVMVQFQCGEDLPDPEICTKSNLVFPSGETLPECWRNGHYRQS